MTCIRTVLLYSSNDRSQIYMDKYGKLSLNCPCYPFFTKSTVTDVMFLFFFFFLFLTLLHLEMPKLYTIPAFLNAIGLSILHSPEALYIFQFNYNLQHPYSEGNGCTTNFSMGKNFQV